MSWAPRGFGVNSIRPGLIRTDLVEPIIDSPELSSDYAISTPLPRQGEVEDVANLAMFLLSDAASFITGQVINCRRRPDAAAGPGFHGDVGTGVRRRRATRSGLSRPLSPRPLSRLGRGSGGVGLGVDSFSANVN